MEWILAVVGLVAGLVGAFMSSDSNSETNQTNRDIAGQQNQFNLEQWQREVAYNTPVQQRQRLEEAGLNPSLAMTQGNVFSTEVAHGFPAAGATMQPFQFDTSSLGQMIANTPLQSAQIKLQEAEAEKAEADAEESRSRIPVNEQEVEQIKTLINKTEAETDEIRRRTDFYEVQEFVTMQDSHMNMLMTLQNMAESESRQSLTDKEVEHFDERLRAELARQRAETKKLLSDSKFIDAQVEKIRQEMKYASEDRRIELSEKFGPNPTASHVREVLQKESETYFSELEGDLREANYQKGGYAFIATRIQRHWQGFVGPMFGAGLDTYKASRSAPKPKPKPKPVG